MAIAARTATHASTTAGTTVVGVEPTGAAENDILFFWAQFDGNALGFTSGPSGWTLLNSWTSDVNQYAYLYWVRRGSSALTEAQRTLTCFGGGWLEVEISCFSGCLASGNPYDDAQYSTQGDRAACNSPSATSSGTGRVALSFGMSWDGIDNDPAATAPTNYTFTRTIVNGEGAFSAYRAVGSGAEDPGAFSANLGTDACSEATIILTPATGTQSNAPRVTRHLQNMMRG